MPDTRQDPDRPPAVEARSRGTAKARFSVLGERDFRRFFFGYCTSLLGTAMGGVALVFAVLEYVGSGTDLGYVLAARIVPQVALVLGGGVLADRLPRRLVMLGSDLLSGVSRLLLAGALLAGFGPLWLFLAAAVAGGVGDAFFRPAMSGLVPEIVSPNRLSDANALTGMVLPGANVAGPALSGALVAVAGSATVLAVDGVTYLVSAVCLAGLAIRPASRVPAGRGPAQVLRDLRDGWATFTALTWLWVTTLQFCLFNLLVWAPYLVLGPVLADQRYGGARAWGVVLAGYGAGAVLGGLALLGRRVRRPVLAASIATFGYAAPPAALAAGLPIGGVIAAALLAGCGSGVGGALEQTAVQVLVPRDMLGRAASYQVFGAFGLGPIGLAVAGPVAGVVGVDTVLGFGVCWQLVTCVVVVVLPAIRAVKLPAGDGEVAG